MPGRIHGVAAAGNFPIPHVRERTCARGNPLEETSRQRQVTDVVCQAMEDLSLITAA